MPPDPVTPKKMPYDKYKPFRPLPLRYPIASGRTADREGAAVVLGRPADGNQALIDPMDRLASCACSRRS